MSRAQASGRTGGAGRAAGAFAAACVRLRFVIVGFWIAAAVVTTFALPTIREAQSGALGDLVPDGADAVEAEMRSKELFGFPLLSRTLVVQRDPQGLPPQAQAEVISRSAALNRGAFEGLTGIAGALPVTNTLGKPPFSRERGTTAITYLFYPPGIGPVGRTGLAERLIERRIEPGRDRFVGVTGTVQARARQAELIEDSLPLVELGTLLLVLGVVGVHFRAIGAPLINLLAVAIAYLVSIRLIAFLGQQLGISVPSEVEPVIVVLLFGVITDYSIFFLSRFRHRLADGEEARVASTRATAELLPIIVTAGLTVVLASAALLVAELGFFTAFGPGMAMAVLVGLIVAITFVPAVLAIGGSALFWPRVPDARSDARAPRATGAKSRPQRARAVDLASAHPVPTAIVCTAVLLVAASGLMRLELGNPLIRGLPDDSQAKQAYVAASEGFTPGILSPTVVVVERPGILRRRVALARLQRAIGRQPGVAAVLGPAEQPLSSAFGVALSPTGDAARYFVVFGSDPLGSVAIERFDSLRARMPVLLGSSGLPAAEASFAGDTALSAETIEKTVADLGRIAPAALLVVFAVLSVFLRALVAPLYLLAASVLALAAALGLTAYVFQDLLGHGELTYYVPFSAAVLLLSLGSDYNVFLVGRIWSEARERPLRDAVRVAGRRAATPITVAGIVLALSFALLALVPVRPFRELAFAMGVGLLIDAFLVRTLLVPALISLVGHRSAWPGRLLARGEAP